MGIFGKVYFPRLTVPVATVFANLTTLTVHIVVFIAVLAINMWMNGAFRPSAWIVLCPLLFVANAILALGGGLFFSALTTRYRDLIPLLGFGMQLWMYLTPVIYPLSEIPEPWRLVMALNPMSTSVELFRLWAFGAGSVSLPQVLVSSTVAVTMVLAGLMLFHRAEQNAADTV